MAKLSNRQKSNIQAKWDTGQYTKLQLSKTYKVSDVMIGKIVGKEAPANAYIVEAQMLIEDVKKFEKSSVEIQAINQAVEYRLKEIYADDKKRVKVYDLTDKILDKVSGMLDKGTKQIVAKVKQYDGKASSESLDVVNVELDPSDLKNMQETVDKASITNNTNHRHAPKQDINITQQQANITDNAPKTLDDFYIETEVING